MCGKWKKWTADARRYGRRAWKQTRRALSRAAKTIRLYWQPALVIGGIWLAILGVTFTVAGLLGFWPSATVLGVTTAAFGLWWTRIRIEG